MKNFILLFSLVFSLTADAGCLTFLKKTYDLFQKRKIEKTVNDLLSLTAQRRKRLDIEIDRFTFEYNLETLSITTIPWKHLRVFLQSNSLNGTSQKRLIRHYWREITKGTILLQWSRNLQKELLYEALRNSNAAERIYIKSSGNQKHDKIYRKIN